MFEPDTWMETLADLSGGSDAERVDLIRRLEELKAGAAAAQARLSAALDASQRAAQAAAGVPARRQGAGVGAQVALARRESPQRGSQHLGLARVLCAEMPHTLAALTAGRLSEWRATLLARETACLSLEHRRTVDATLAGDPHLLEGLGDAALVRRTRMLAYRLDPASVVARSRKAAAERRVTCRPAPDTMAYLTALLPAAQAVAVYAALTRHADSVRAAGDDRTRGQVMADTLVERVTGQATADAVQAEVQVVITDRALVHGGAEPGLLHGYGPVPSEVTRDLIRAAGSAWVRRLYTAPSTGELVAMESTRRCFEGRLRSFIVARDQICRTPWCDAPVRHGDHVVPAEDGGATTAGNGQGLCEACNYARQAPGWAGRSEAGGGEGRHTVVITTPTGHAYRSTAPPLPGTPDAARAHDSPLERAFAEVIRVA